MGDNDPGSINTQMKLLPASPPVPSVFRGSPFPFAQNRQSRAIDDQMHAFAGRDSIKPELELLTTPGERRVIGRGELEAHHPEERLQEPRGLAQGQVEEETERQCDFDGDVGILLLPPASADAWGLPGGDRLG